MLRIAWYPAMKIIRLTTVATTGRLMNRSVKLISFSRPSTVGRVRRQLAVRLDLVIDSHAGPALQPKHAGSDYFIARLQSGNNRNHVAARLTKLNKLLLHSFILFSFRVFHFGDDENGIAIRRIMDAGGRDRHDVLPFAHQDADFGKH